MLVLGGSDILVHFGGFSMSLHAVHCEHCVIDCPQREAGTTEDPGAMTGTL
jgi:hypothetical protein